MNYRRSLSILTLVLAFSAVSAPAFGQFYVAPSERELLLFINVAGGTGWLQPFYEFVEFGAEGLAKGIVGPRYNRVWTVTGGSTTRNGLRAWLNYIASRSNVKAVDLIFVTHGLSSSMSFADGTYSSSSVATYLRNNISSSRRSKFRMCFSTACYGASHRQAWRDAGFEAVSGSREVYADSALSYAPFLNSWRNYNTFRNAVIAANNADPLRTQDSIAAGILWSLGSSHWDNVDSYRLRQGYTSDIRVHRHR